MANPKSHKRRSSPSKSTLKESPNSVENSETLYPRAGFFRRIAAMIYDGLVAVAVGMCAGLIILVALTILHANKVIGAEIEHFSDFLTQSILFTSIVQLWVLAWSDHLDSFPLEQGVIYSLWMFALRYIAPLAVMFVFVSTLLS